METKTYLMTFLFVISIQYTKTDQYQYCVIGAGPSGLQMGYYLQKSGRDYVIFEKSSIAGSFYTHYPRHRTLISINKRNTGSTNKEYNMRHDWNSLISDNEKLLFRHYSKDMFPDADVMVRYLNDYANYYKLNIQYNREVSISVQHKTNDRKETLFYLVDQQQRITKCRIVIVATGLSVPNIPDMVGVDLTVGYENISTNPGEYEGKSVLILGRGNSAFETANSIYENTNFVHMVGRQRIRLAWETHYVGDLRAVNNGLLDTYQLKSLDGLIEFNDIKNYKVVQENGKLFLRDRKDNQKSWEFYDNDPLLMPYDYIIRCLGFQFDRSIFLNESVFARGKGRVKKYPVISDDFQSTDTDGIYFAGTNTHSLDFRESAGGFIHGFRYTVKSLHHILSWRYHQETWPSQNLPIHQIVPTIVKRLSETSSLYQMFGFLGDVVVFSNDNKQFEYFEDYPIKLLPRFVNTTGVSISGKDIIVIVLQYGNGYKGPMEDVFRLDRAATSARWAHLSNFLHPVLYYYDRNTAGKSFSGMQKEQLLPRPTRLHHMVEDFNTIWHHPYTHIQPLTTFLENCIKTDLSLYSNEMCLLYSLTNKKVPVMCSHYINDRTSVLSTDSSCLDIQKIVEI